MNSFDALEQVNTIDARRFRSAFMEGLRDFSLRWKDSRVIPRTHPTVRVEQVVEREPRWRVA